MIAKLTKIVVVRFLAIRHSLTIREPSKINMLEKNSTLQDLRKCAAGMTALLLLITCFGLAVTSSEAQQPFSAKRADYIRVISARDAYLGAFLGRVQSVDELEANGFRGRDDLGYIKLPIPWNLDTGGDRNLQLQLEIWWHAAPYFRDYLKRSNTKSVRKAFATADSWIRYYHAAQPHDLTWSDAVTGIRAYLIAVLLDAAYSGDLPLTEAEYDTLISVADDHANRLQVKSFIKINNHGFFQVFGLEALCRVMPDRDSCKSALPFAKENFHKIFSKRYTKDGFFVENSPGYHYHITDILRSFDTLKLAEPAEMALLDLAEERKKWLVLPDERVVPVGDGIERGKTGVFDNSESVSLGDGRVFAMGNFLASGYAIVRSLPQSGAHQSMLFVNGMASVRTHKHADDLSFVLYERDQLVFTDGGQYSYNKDAFRRHFESADAHNTVGLLNQVIVPKDVKLQRTLLRRFSISGDQFVVEGKAERPGLFKQARQIIYRPGHQIEIVDTLSAISNQEFVSTLLFANDIRPVLTGNSFLAVLRDGTTVHGKMTSENCTVEAKRGSESPLLGWESLAYLNTTAATAVRAICSGDYRVIRWLITFDSPT